MATSLQFCGVKSPNPAFMRRSLHQQALCLQQLNIARSLDFTSGFGSSVRNSCKSRALRVSCEGRNVDVIERSQTEIGTLGEANEQLTCVMKFGGSSVASADRMREIADLILSFPNERPVVVLSAMGKTTNKLLLVLIVMAFNACTSLLSLLIVVGNLL